MAWKPNGDREAAGHKLLAQYGIRVGADHPLLRVPPMTAHPGTQRFDLDRALRDADRRRQQAFLVEPGGADRRRRVSAIGSRAEFPAASSMFDDPGRRQFLKLMGASLLLGGLDRLRRTNSSD